MMEGHPPAVALVTGGDGQLGTALCDALTVAGYRTYSGDIGGHNSQSGDTPALTGSSTATRLELDVTNPDSVDAGIRELTTREGRLDLLVNNAGVAVFTPFTERTVEEYRHVFDVNVLGTILCTNAAARVMTKQVTGGAIVNIASIYGIVSGDPSVYTDCARNTSEVYAGSKAAIIQMTRYWAVHLAPRRIRVNSVSPGGILAGQGADFISRYTAKTPLARMADVTDIVGSVVFLASDSAAYVTGHNLVVDGGLTIW